MDRLRHLDAPLGDVRVAELIEEQRPERREQMVLQVLAPTSPGRRPT